MGSYSAFQTITACLDEKLATGRAKHDDSSFRAHSLKASWALVLSRFSENQTLSFAVLETPKAPVDSRCLESACIISPHVETWQISGNPDTLLVDAAKLQQRKPWLETGGNRRSDATTAVVIRSHGGLGDTHSALSSLHACELVLTLDCSSPRPQVSLDYLSTSISINQARTQLCSLVHILEQMIASPELTFRELDFLGAYSTGLLRQWNVRPVQHQVCIHSLIQDRCRSQPDAEALCAWDGALTYAKLDELSLAVGLQLQSLGVAPESKVPLCFEKSLWTVVAILGVLRAGGAFVLLDPSHPVPRLAEICSQVQADVVITSDSLREMGANLAPRAIALPDTLSKESLSPCNSTLESTVTPANAAYVAFTSGSTGKPKGIVIEHQSFCANALAQNEIQNLDNKTRAFQFASYGFDSSILEMLMTLIAGGCVCIPSEKQRLNGLAAAINNLRANWVELTPSVARLIKPEQIPNVRSLLLVGEPMTQDQIAQWTGKVQLINAYGPAECSVVTSIQPDVRLQDPYNVGRPHSSRCWIVNRQDHHQLEPLGAVGELLISGPIVGRGYLNQPQQKSFVSSPKWATTEFAIPAEERFYKTGDLFRYNVEDGTLRYIGRKDTQVKIHGQRVDLQEIEHHARRFQEGIDAVADVVNPSNTNGGKLLALFVTAAEADADQDEAFSAPMDDAFCALSNSLQDWLRERLPAFMVPTKYIPVKRFPLTKTGKLDRRALVNLAAQFGGTRARGEPERDRGNGKDSGLLHKEESIRALFAEVLGCPEKDISAHDGFYDLGGNSLAAIELVARARDRGLEITVADVIRLQTVQQIAGCALANRDVHIIAPFALLADVEQSLSTAAAQCRVERDMVEDMYACTPLQAGLVYLSIKNPGSFVSTYRFSFTPSVSLDRFQEAWKRTYLAHPMLRTCVVQLQDGQLLQVVIKAKALSTSSLAKDNAETMALGRPLTRWELRHARGSKPAVFTLTMHHAVFDGWSFIQVLDDLQKGYDGHALPSRPSFNRVIDYISRLDMSAAYRFWSQEFTGLRATVFPDSCNRSSVVSPRPSSRSDRIPLATADKDWTLANKIKLAWALVVSAQTGSNDVVYGLTVSGRNAPVPGIDCIAGPTIATFPFRTQLDPHSSVEDMLLRLREHDVAIIPFEQTGLARISEASPEAALACRFQNLLTIRLSSVQSPSAILTDLPENEHQELLFASYPLSIVAQQRAESLEIKAFFDSTVLDTNRVQMLLDQFATALQRILRDPGTQMGQLMTQNPPDWDQLAVWNRKDNPERLRCMHEVIIDFCLTQPDAEAVCAWDGSLKYHELLSLSRGVAGHLQSRGWCRGTAVGICMERSKWFPVAMLGVLMSGAAMVLLEPNFPIPRLQQIVQDADARVVICSPALQDKCKKIVDSTVTLTSDIVLADYCSWSQSSMTPQDPMYVAFTSGSTGTPKGVVIEHGMVYSVVHGHKDVISVSNTSRGLLFASPAFDICLAEVMFMLAAGGCLCIPSEDQRMNKLACAMTDMRVNIAMLTPSVARTISPTEVPCLQTLVLGGEAPSATDLATWASQVRLHQSYGPAECTMYTTTTGPLSPASDPSNVGSCPNASCWIVNPDNHHQLRPVGSVGELLIGGPIVGRGYKKRTAETEAAFIRNPSWCVKFPFLQGHRLYKTGDLAVFRPDGSLSLVGRKDAQIKLHGQRIELHDIEHCAEQYEQQTAAIAGLVTLREIAEPRLILFVYNPKQVDTTSVHFPNHERQELFLPPSSEIRSQLQGLKTHLSQHLPSFMVPSLLIPLSSLPLSPSGKADRKKLREEAGNLTREIVTEYLGHAASHKKQPITEQERFVRASFAKVLSLDEESIGVDDDFFALGGDSISAMQLLTLCRKGNLALSMLDFLSYNTVSLFCEHACSTHDESVAPSKKQSHEASAPRDTTSKADGPLAEFPEAEMQLIQSLLNVANINDIEDVYSCSDAHAGVLELYTPNYSSTAIFEIRTRKAVTLSQVVAAWNRLVQHHAALRTIVLHVPNLHVGYLHVVLKQVPADVVILPRSQNVRQEVEKLEPVSSWKATPPHRLVVGQEDDGTVILRLDTGRALIDAISIEILLEGFCLALHGRFSASKETPYRQYLTYLRSQSREEALQFWKQTLSETRPCNLPRVPSELHQPCRSRPCKARSLRRSLRVEKFDRLTSFWRSNHVTLTNIFQLAWALTLQHYTKSRDVCFGTVISGRDIPLPAIWQMVGTFFNVVPCRFILEPASTVLDTLRQNQEEMQRRNEHQHCSMPAAVRQAGIVGVAGLQQLFNTVLTVQNVVEVGSSRDKGNGDEIVMKLVELEDATEYDFCVAVLLSPSQIDVELRYWASSASEDYASRILECFLHHLEESLHHVSEPLNAIAGFE